MKYVRQNVGERFWIAGHLQRHIESFFHPQLLHRIGDLFRTHIQRQIRSHFAREIQTIRIDVCNHDVTRAGSFANRDRHAADWSRAGDEHIFTDQIERERRVDGVAHRIEARKHIE